MIRIREERKVVNWQDKGERCGAIAIDLCNELEQIMFLNLVALWPKERVYFQLISNKYPLLQPKTWVLSQHLIFWGRKGPQDGKPF